jgi:hypothetical protein
MHLARQASPPRSKPLTSGRSGGGASIRLVLIGDLIHAGAVQLASPKITIGCDSDAKPLAKDGGVVK